MPRVNEKDKENYNRGEERNYFRGRGGTYRGNYRGRGRGGRGRSYAGRGEYSNAPPPPGEGNTGFRGRGNLVGGQYIPGFTWKMKEKMKEKLRNAQDEVIQEHREEMRKRNVENK